VVVSGGEDPPRRVGVALRLYVAADSAPSMLARRQLEFVRERLDGEDWELEVVDVFESPDEYEITDTGMRLLGPIRGVRGVLAGLAEFTPEVHGSEGNAGPRP
jgi:hypothetical protein